MRPRAHNVLSYSVTLLVFVGVLGWWAGSASLSGNASLGAALWLAHFLRRTLESAFVHRYGKPSVSAADYLTEYVYYWGFAAWIAASLASPVHRAPAVGLQMAGLVVFALAEAGNARAHVMLRRLRPAGSRAKRIPRGFLFEWVSCPHYLCEILAWVGFNLVTGTLAGLAFMLLGAGILLTLAINDVTVTIGLAFMLLGAGILGTWAHSRHVAYQQEFPTRHGGEGYPAKRRALLPGVF